VIDYPDTSFLCAVYRVQARHLEAKAYRRTIQGPLAYTSLLEFEFLQALRLQVFLHASDVTKGLSLQQADQIAADWDADIAAGLLQQVSYDAEAVNKLARTYSDLYTIRGGHRSLDILHVATAVHLGAKQFLTFDARQKTLAQTAGMTVPF
jgi:predicted nucleic acid-binding protein